MKMLISFVVVIGVIAAALLISKLNNAQSGSLIAPALPFPLTQSRSNSQSQEKSSLFNENKPAPEFVGITMWLNPEKSLTMQDLLGKVVLIDFWTNQCINCIHTLPYVTKLYDTYKDQGFVVIGVHTPELAYERTAGSIEQAIKTYSIHYPIAQDNDYATWNAYDNQYWPAEYLVDKKGNIRRTYFGEGEYDRTEQAVQELIKE